MVCIRNGRIHDAVQRDPYTADMLIENGKIKVIGENLTIPEDCEIIDATGLDVFPGFVDAHTHIGLDGYGIGYEGHDYNEMNDICSPQLRALTVSTRWTPRLPAPVKPALPAFAPAPAVPMYWAEPLPRSKPSAAA